MIKKTCSNCHTNFMTNKSFATLCSQCFFETMENRLCPYCPSYFWTEKTRLEAWPCKGCQNKVLSDLLRKTEHDYNLTLPADFLRDLIFLVHPDKHANSEKATKATQRLLELRQQREVV